MKGECTMSKQDQDQEGKRQRICATMHVHRRLAALDPEYRRRCRELEIEIRHFIARYAAQGLRTGVVRIPVVVHVIWNTAAQNISDAQIQSQLDVLNADFRGTNADAGSVPAVFSNTWDLPPGRSCGLWLISHLRPLFLKVQRSRLMLGNFSCFWVNRRFMNDCEDPSINHGVPNNPISCRAGALACNVQRRKAILHDFLRGLLLRSI